MAAMPWTVLCSINELAEGSARHAEAGGLHLAVYLHNGRPFVMDNYCPHAGGSLAAGFVEVDDSGAACAVCPWHYWKFRLDTGMLSSSPHVKVQTYPVRTRSDGAVEADLPSL